MDEHVPVLYQEILNYLQPRSGGLYVDGTVGAGGHARGLLEGSSPDGRLLAFDRDEQAIAFARQKLETYGVRAVFVQASYAEMASLAPSHGFERVDGILLDLGLSSRQLADPDRGFSFGKEGPLDMRFNQGSGRTAADLVNDLSERQLADVLWRYGEVRPNRKLARAIVHQRPIRTTSELADVVAAEVGQRGRIHPATQVFQALRIAVNDELGALEQGLSASVDLLKPGGRLAVISFHSLEDRIVKHFIRERGRECVCPPSQPICTCDAQPTLKSITRKPIRPTDDEVARNPRSRSARLRVAERVSGEDRDR
jgi:16S rRNA (cytosine1402-N4)-methyltransferase